MKLLLMIGQLVRGGAEQQMVNLLSQLPEPARVIAFTSGGDWGNTIREMGHDLIELERGGYGDLARFVAVTRAIDDYRPDVAHLFLDGVRGLYGRVGAALNLHPRLVIGERNVPTYYPAWYQRALPVMNRFAAAVVCNSHSAAAYYRDHKLAPAEKIHVIPNGIDVAAIQNAPEIEYPFPDEWRGKPIIAQIGGLAWRKAPEMFVQTAARVSAERPDARFVMIGDGDLRREVETLRESLGLGEVLLLTGVRDDVPSLMRHLDIIALASRSEGTSNVILEAMALGLPCVVTDTGDSRHLVESAGNGFVASVGDVDALAREWITLIDNPDLRRVLGEKGVEYVEQFTIPRMAEQYLALYENLMQSS